MLVHRPDPTAQTYCKSKSSASRSGGRGVSLLSPSCTLSVAVSEIEWSTIKTHPAQIVRALNWQFGELELHSALATQCTTTSSLPISNCSTGTRCYDFACIMSSIVIPISTLHLYFEVEAPFSPRVEPSTRELSSSLEIMKMCFKLLFWQLLQQLFNSNVADTVLQSATEFFQPQYDNCPILL